MSVYQILKENTKRIVPFFENWQETMIWSYLQGYMGTAWADSNRKPKSVQIVIADFCFFAGEINKALVQNKPPQYNSDFIIMIPQNEEWSKLIKEVYGKNAKKITRYAIKKEPDIFDVKKLTEITRAVNKDYDIRLIDRKIYDDTKKNKWSEDLCSQFENYDEYNKNGLGVVALHNGELVSGASSYTVYRDGIEIEIDTREDYRRKGLALICGAKLILECIKRNLYPSWDAHNKESVALAEKLGYNFDKEYTAYIIYDYGTK